MKYVDALKDFLIENEEYNDFAFHCPTLEDAQILVKTLYSLGFYWSKDSVYSDEEVKKRWSAKGKNTCITIGTKNINDKNILFNGRMGMYVNQHRAIVKVSELFADVDERETENISSVEENNAIKNENTNDDVFTINSDETTVTLESNTTEKICPQCNKKISSSAKFCTSCGHKFISEVKTEDVDLLTKPQPKKAEPKNYEEKSEISEAIPPSQNKNVRSMLDLINSSNNVQKQESEKEISADDEKTNKSSTLIDNALKESKKGNVDDFVVAKKTKEKEDITLDSADIKNDDLLLCNILNIKVGQRFKISNNLYNANNDIYRINKYGFREKYFGGDIWFVSNSEQELAFLIQHPDQIIKL